MRRTTLDQWRTLGELADLIGCSSRTLQRWCNQPSPIEHMNWRRATDPKKGRVSTIRMVAYWIGRHRVFLATLTPEAQAFLRRAMESDNGDDNSVGHAEPSGGLPADEEREKA